MASLKRASLLYRRPCGDAGHSSRLAVRQCASATPRPNLGLPLPVAFFPIGSFDNERKGFVLSLSPFRGSFFHQGLQGFLFLLLPTVLAFTHYCYSL
jgi:hypothetical protein